ncbi:hypothetical protein Sa4125_00250 [Aureimonas sp. SA4125]|uniref:hypothetical protein n=1 Tax=Aureimonas sp. SA4125 TaxID=2826993 RepID=UPI001CC5FAD8|nr:hypothetical protein [Aureimonas sp. SA4125]BDA82483.1 hypothetical protein Sa4125_00250 [Aureimonas sp. SA4125]
MMGWRTDDAYEKTRQADHAAWLASLSRQDRLRVLAGEWFRLAALAGFVGFAAYLLTRSTPPT